MEVFSFCQKSSQACSHCAENSGWYPIPSRYRRLLVLFTRSCFTTQFTHTSLLYLYNFNCFILLSYYLHNKFNYSIIYCTTAKHFTILRFFFQVSFVFQPPSYIIPDTQLLANCHIAPSPTVQLAMQLPSSCFEAKDYLNNVYFLKRSMYLWLAAAQVTKISKKRVKCEVVCHSWDPRDLSMVAKI